MANLLNKSTGSKNPVSGTSASPNHAAFIPELLTASGPFDFPMTNDYMFRAVLQSSNKALKELLSSLLHIPPENIASVVVTNPIILGDTCEDKEFRLDINLLLNNHSLINLEMQVVYQSDWHDRSLIYLCRNFDNLSKGQDYSRIKPVTHIGILNSAPSYEGEEFYSQNMLMNVKSYKIYSDKLSLHVLNLNQIQHATSEDKAWEIDKWAALFKADTWETIKMISQNNEYLTEASNTIFRMNADDMARKRAQDREDYYRDIRTWKKDVEELKSAIAEKDTALATQATLITKKDTALAAQATLITEKDATIKEQAALIAELKSQLSTPNT